MNIQEFQDRLAGKTLEEQITLWEDELDFRDAPAGFDILLSQIESIQVVCELAKRHWNRPDYVARRIIGSKLASPIIRPIKRVGFYYFTRGFGGTERVAALLGDIWQDAGYDVCAYFYDANSTAPQFPLARQIKYIPIAQANINNTGDAYQNRAISLERALKSSHVDVLVYHAWVSHSLLWDMLIAKSCGIPMIIHCHGVFSYLLTSKDPSFSMLPDIYRLADGVVTLSRVDERYWSHFNSNIHLVSNPFTFSLAATPISKLNTYDAVWVGRIAEEKNPMDLIEITAIIAKTMPEFRLLLIGGALDERIQQELLAWIRVYGVQKNVILEGYQKNVLPYYLRASAFLMTSKFEGFSMALLEALSAGLPIVMYDLPYLLLAEGNEGIISVPMNDTHAAANAILKLMKNPALRASTGAASRRYVEMLCQYDFQKEWQKIFKSIENERPALCVDPTEEMLWKMLHRNYLDGVMPRLRNELPIEAKPVFYHRSYLIGCAITRPARMVRDAFRAFVKYCSGKK